MNNFDEHQSKDLVNNVEKSPGVTEISHENELKSTGKYSKSNSPVVANEDEDSAIEGDGNTKDFEGNIDKDELLKDTEADDSRNTGNNDELNTALPAEEMNNKNIENIQHTNLDIDRDKVEVSDIMDKTEQVESVNHVDAVSNDKGVLDSSNNESVDKDLVECIDKEGVTENDDSCESQSNKVGHEDVDSSSNLFTDDESNKDRAVSSNIENESADNVGTVYSKSITEDTGICDVNEDKSNTNEENDTEASFLHVDQDSSRHDEAESMEVDGIDPFAQTSNDTLNNSGSSEKENENSESNVESNNENVIENSDSNLESDKHKEIIEENSVPSEEVDKEKETPFQTLNTQVEDTDIEMGEANNEIEQNDNNISQAITQPSDESQNVEKGSTEDNALDSQNVQNDVTDETTSGTDTQTPEDNENCSANETTIQVKDNENGPKKDLQQVEGIESGPDNSSQTIENVDAETKSDSQIETGKDTDCNLGTESQMMENKDSESINENVTNKNKQTKEGNNVSVVLDESTNNNTPAMFGYITPSKFSKVQSRSKNKRKLSSGSSEDSDLELDSLGTKPRPKRSAAKKAESQIKVLSAAEQEAEQEDNDSNGVETVVDEAEELQKCHTCDKEGLCKVNVLVFGKTNYFCNDSCFTKFRDGPIHRPTTVDSMEIVPPSVTVMKEIRSTVIKPIERSDFVRKCSQCSSVVKNDDEKTLSWETMDFCSEECLGKYQQELGAHCANCRGSVQPASLGKYCVRFGYEVKQFCCSTCLEEFKKGLKVCSYCQKDISSGAEGFLAPVGDKGQFKDFCTQACMEKYELMSSGNPPPPQVTACHVCSNNKLVEIEVFFDNKVSKLCSDICFTAYKFANKLVVDRCDMCHKYFDKEASGEKFNIFYDDLPHNFCCKTCMNIYILAKRRIVPCNWCKVKKYNFDMIKRVTMAGQVLEMCSLNCLTLYQVSVNAVSSRRIKCDMCQSVAQAQYHLTMSDATIRNFCTYPCVMNFQQQYSKSPITLPGSDMPPIPTGAPKRVVPKGESAAVPVISSVASLANGQPATTTASKVSTGSGSGKLNLVTRLCEPPVCRNKNTQTRPLMSTKSVSCRPHSTSVAIQADETKGPAVIPIPVPIYIPCPMAMYSLPFPVPVPFPIPVPVPVFLPTTRNSIKGIMDEIKKIQEKVPADPFEAELLMMAAMVAGDKKEEATSSESEAENEPAAPDPKSDSDREDHFSPEPAESSNTFGDDIMQMALKIANELDEPAEDLETRLPSSSIVSQSENDGENSTKRSVPETRGRKRSLAKTPQKRSGSSDKRRKKSSQVQETASPAAEEPKPDANMKLKFTFGVNAWKSWITQKNAEIEKLNTANKKVKPFKTDILQLTADELNFSLCLFVKEVKKPNGSSYAPDTIYYLCLGIQQYLFENGRIDNIFTDASYEPFTDALDEVAKKFSELYSDHHYIVTRVEEEHLWESKQLGAHSPHVLLTTLMFFNTKHFNLTNTDEHMLLSFSHIMKHWKRGPNSEGGKGRPAQARNTLLRFYPPQSVLDDPNSKKKKMYEQHENEENPLRCPVKLYEFYLSKCPESVKTRNDLFYLQPERSCVPDSPVWYSTMALSKPPLEKMLNRIRMVKEINIALLTP